MRRPPNARRRAGSSRTLPRPAAGAFGRPRCSSPWAREDRPARSGSGMRRSCWESPSRRRTASGSSARSRSRSSRSALTTPSISARAAEIQERDAGAGAGGIAGACDFHEIAVGDQAERHRMDRIDMGAEGAGERDALGRCPAPPFDQELCAGIERGLGELDGAHVRLVDQKPRRAVVQHIGVRCGRPPRCADCARPSAPSITPSCGDDSGKVHLGDRLDDARSRRRR